MGVFTLNTNTFKAVYDETDEINTLTFYYDALDRSGEKKTVYELSADVLSTGVWTYDIRVTKKAVEGEVVVVTIVPNEGYKLSSLSYNDGTDDYDITETDNVYSFEMPATAVTVSATFEEKQTFSITETAQNYTYDKSAKPFAIQGTSLTGFIVQYYVDNAWTETAPTNAGSYNVKITRPEDDVYKAFLAEIENGLVIDKAVPTVGAPVASDITYGESLEKSKITGVNLGSIKWKDASFVPDGAGNKSSVAVFTPTDTDNYLVTEVIVSLFVQPKTIEIVWLQADSEGNIALAYNGKSIIPKAVANNLVGEDTCELTVEGDEAIFPGFYNAKVTALSNLNYILPKKITHTYVIVPAEMKDVIVNDVNVAYDAKEHSIEVVNPPANSVIEFSTDGENYSPNKPMFLQLCARETVWYRISCTGYVTLEGTAYVTIVKATYDMSGVTFNNVS
ncbi:MAG: hypothetical protein MJ072_04340, partial [Clostridia bacterium]|nr:hypothetical protein [Clostridia bacterium]